MKGSPCGSGWNCCDFTLVAPHSSWYSCFIQLEGAFGGSKRGTRDASDDPPPLSRSFLSMQFLGNILSNNHLWEIPDLLLEGRGYNPVIRFHPTGGWGVMQLNVLNFIFTELNFFLFVLQMPSGFPIIPISFIGKNYYCITRNCHLNSLLTSCRNIIQYNHSSITQALWVPIHKH